ncbi:F-box protein skip23 [Rhynchospora pubera]|uniref:F-box protein skip23 n=1 Tax=Rhynchospora pubera TaxID=906938 RepID=A0AAV8DSZ1_9POAL|nr:F-box protein skip23 [Rhynchospora pubera]
MPKQGSSCSSSEFRDWAHLPPEVVELISERVKSITDYVRFRAVCSPWRTTALPKPRQRLPPQLPWLMLPHCWNDLSWVSFDDVWESKTRRFHLPVTRDMEFCGCYCGWIMVADHLGKEVLLVNPLIQTRIQLPPFEAPVRRLGDDSDVPYYNTLFIYSRGYSGSFASGKMIFSTDLTDPNCLITVLLGGSWGICCRIGDPYWTRVDCCLSHQSSYSDVTYYNGRFYFLYDYDEGIAIIDSNGHEERIAPMPDLRRVRKYFVEGKSGVYVLAIRPEEKFELYQLLEQPMKLEPIVDTSDSTAIFYGDYYPCLAVSTDDLGSLDGDSVFMEHKCAYNDWKCAWNCAIGSRCNIYSAQRDEENNEHLGHGLDKKTRYLGDQVMWFQPSFL